MIGVIKKILTGEIVQISKLRIEPWSSAELRSKVMEWWALNKKIDS